MGKANRLLAQTLLGKGQRGGVCEGKGSLKRKCEGKGGTALTGSARKTVPGTEVRLCEGAGAGESSGCAGT